MTSLKLCCHVPGRNLIIDPHLSYSYIGIRTKSDEWLLMALSIRRTITRVRVMSIRRNEVLIPYLQGLWSNNLRDADAALFDIYESCVRAGPQKCLIYEEKADLVAKRVDKLLAKIKAKPLSYMSIGREGPFGHSYGLFDYSVLKGLIFDALYNTHGNGWSLALLLAKIESDHLLVFRRPLDYMFTCECSEPGKKIRPWSGNTPTLAIACGDGPLVDETLEEARAFFEGLAQNTSFSDVWPFRLFCS